MARPKRINLPFTLYHVMSRTISGEIAFRGIADYNKFIHYLSKYAHLFDFRVHTYCLLSTHFHLLLESGRQKSLSELMRRLLTAYTVYYNRRHGRHGHLFQGRFKSLVVDKSDYLLLLSRYIHTNPARLSKPLDPETYRWSSLHYYINGHEPSFLCTREILQWFQGNRKEYAQYVKEGLSEENKPLIFAQRFVGGEAFVKRWTARIKVFGKKTSRPDMRDHKREEELAKQILGHVASEYRCLPKVLLRARRRQGTLGDARTVLINLLRDNLSWTCQEIASFLNLKEKTMVYHHQYKLQENKNLYKIYMNIGQKLHLDH